MRITIDSLKDGSRVFADTPVHNWHVEQDYPRGEIVLQNPSEHINIRLSGDYAEFRTLDGVIKYLLEGKE